MANDARPTFGRRLLIFRAQTRCTREITGRGLELPELVGGAGRERSRAFRAHLKELGIVHRRGGYGDPESQVFIESWFSKLDERCVWREEFETLDQARAAIAAYVDPDHHRPHRSLNYRSPLEVRHSWEDGRALVKSAA
jgi:transposase InsO family protein